MTVPWPLASADTSVTYARLFHEPDEELMWSAGSVPPAGVTGVWAKDLPYVLAPPVNATPATAVQAPLNTTVETSTLGQTQDPLAPTDTALPAWYSVTAGSETALVIDATSSDFDTAVAVYSGSPNTTVQDYGLTLEAKGSGKIEFKPKASTTYQVAVGGKVDGTVKSGQQKVKTLLSTLLGAWGVQI